MHKACFLASATVSSACVTVLLRLTFPRLSSVHISKQLETCSALLLKARLTQCFLLAPDRFTPCPAFAHAHAFQEWVHAPRMQCMASEQQCMADLETVPAGNCFRSMVRLLAQLPEGLIPCLVSSRSCQQDRAKITTFQGEKTSHTHAAPADSIFCWGDTEQPRRMKHLSPCRPQAAPQCEEAPGCQKGPRLHGL